VNLPLYVKRQRSAADGRPGGGFILAGFLFKYCIAVSIHI